MSKLLDVCDSIDEGFNFIVTKISDRNYNETFGVMQDILDAHTAINLQIDMFSRFLGENNLRSVNEQFKNSLSMTVVHFNNEDWDLLDNQLSQQVIPYFLAWKKELHYIITPYITH